MSSLACNVIDIVWEDDFGKIKSMLTEPSETGDIVDPAGMTISRDIKIDPKLRYLVTRQCRARALLNDGRILDSAPYPGVRFPEDRKAAAILAGRVEDACRADIVNELQRFGIPVADPATVL